MTTEQLLYRVPAIADWLKAHPVHALRLHLGCGGQRWKDFINVDLYDFDENVPDSSRSGCVADASGDMRNLGLPDGSVDEIFTSHTIEHFSRWETIDMLGDWYRILKPGGVVTIETPDFVRCILWLFHPLRRKRQLARNMFYGNQWDRIPFETHRYVWSRRELTSALKEAGFQILEATSRTLTHHPGRDQRVVARKPHDTPRTQQS